MSHALIASSSILLKASFYLMSTQPGFACGIRHNAAEGGTAIRLRLYGVFGDPSWIRYGGTDDFVDRVDWSQDRSDEVVLSFELNQPVWGYRTRWDGNDLLLEIRRPPVVNPDSPLSDR